MSNVKETLVVAVDGGGSTCRARLYQTSGNILSESEKGSANITTNFKACHDNVLAAINSAYNSAGLSSSRFSTDIAYIGLAGANIGNGAAILKNSLRFKDSEVVSDREITVAGALGNGDGAVAQVGTGSFFTVRRNGKLFDVGGWGFQLSDDCSGAYLGRKILRATIAAYDGLADSSDLTDKILNQFGGPRKLVSFIQNATPLEYGSFVPDLSSAQNDGDPVACKILEEAVNRMVYIFDKMEVEAVAKLCLMGGVKPTYTRLLPKRYKKIIVEPKGDELDGAYSLAMQNLMTKGN